MTVDRRMLRGKDRKPIQRPRRIAPISLPLGRDYTTLSRAVSVAPGEAESPADDPNTEWILSEPFLEAVRGCVAADITPEQVGAITSLIVTGLRLMMGFREDPSDLGERVKKIAGVMLRHDVVMRVR
jgi:hypothetical protein